MSNVEIDLARARVLRSDNSQITDLDKKSLTWTEQDNALPLPIDWKDPVMSLTIRSSNVIQLLNQQLIKISGLPGRRYRLEIDGEEIGDWSRQEWEQGINLGQYPTPISRQALQVYDLALRHFKVQLASWQGVQVRLQTENSPHIREALNRLDSLNDELVFEERTAAVSKPHHYQLIAAP